MRFYSAVFILGVFVFNCQAAPAVSGNDIAAKCKSIKCDKCLFEAAKTMTDSIAKRHDSVYVAQFLNAVEHCFTLKD